MFRNSRLAIWIFTILLLVSSSFGDEPPSVGYAETDITPAVGGSIPGYFTVRTSTGVLDPLLAKVLVLTKGRMTLVIVALDLIGLQAPEVKEVRRIIGSRTGIAPERIFVHSTHTHTGAETPRRFTTDDEEILPGLFPGTVDREWVSRLPEKVAAAVEKALANRIGESRVTLSTGRPEPIAFYRRYLMKDGTIRTNPGRGNPNIVRPAGEIDPTVYVISFERAKILLVSYGLHPDCIGGTLYSADYPYHLTQSIRALLGKEWSLIYLNAACGNINHVDVNNPNQLKGYEESQRIGRTLAESVKKAREEARTISIDRLASQTKSVQCALRQVPPEIASQAEREVKGSLDIPRRNFNELFSPAAYVLSKTKDRVHPAEMIACRIGPVGLVGLPAEVFVEIAREIKQGSPLDPRLVIGLTGGAMGYMPHAKGFEEGGYEAGYRSARYQPLTPTLWIRAAADLLRNLAGGR